jgi:hypothetical protein
VNIGTDDSSTPGSLTLRDGTDNSGAVIAVIDAAAVASFIFDAVRTLWPSRQLFLSGLIKICRWHCEKVLSEVLSAKLRVSNIRLGRGHGDMSALVLTLTGDAV